MSTRNRRLLFIILTASIGLGAVYGPGWFWKRRALARFEDELQGVTTNEKDENGGQCVSLILSNRPVTKEDIRLLHHLRPIHRLYLFATNFDDDDAEVLLDLHELEWLNIAETKISDKCMPVLAKLPNLKNLNLRKTKLTNEGILLVSQFPQLEFLDVEGTAVTRQAFSTLKKNRPGLTCHPFDTPEDDD